MHDGAESKRHGRGVNHRERLSPCQTCSLPYRGLTLSLLAGKLPGQSPTSLLSLWQPAGRCGTACGEAIHHGPATSKP